MAVPRLYLQHPLKLNREADLGAEHAHYLRNVLRLAAGDRLVLFDGSGGEYLAEILQLGRNGGRCLPVAFRDEDRELKPRVHIVQAAVRSEKLEFMLQKATELGASSFQIVISERAPLRLGGEKLRRRLERWRKIIIESVEQSGRTRLPSVCWRNSLREVAVTAPGFVLHPEAALSWAEVRDQLAAAGDVTFGIGPEGGWSSRDMDQWRRIGMQPLRFGPRILRTETAAPAILAAMQAILD